MELLNFVNNLSDSINSLPETIDKLRKIMRNAYPSLTLEHQNMIIDTITNFYKLGMRYTDWQLRESIIIFNKIKNDLNR